MDYNETYTRLYKSFYLRSENVIRRYFETEKAAKRSFGSVHNEVMMRITRIIESSKTNENKSINESYIIFQRRHDLFEEDHINLVFQHEIVPVFKTFLENNFPQNYSLYKLVRLFAIFNVANEMSRLLHNHSDLFKFYYEFNDFSQFEIVDYENGLTNSEIFKSFHSKKYPPSNSKIYDEIVASNKKNYSTTNLDDSVFTETEKAFLFLCLNELLKTNPKLPKTEIYKLKVLSSHQDHSILTSNRYKNSRYYRVLSEGISNISDELITQISFVSDLHKKIQPFKLLLTSKHLVSKLNNLKVSGISKNK